VVVQVKRKRGIVTVAARRATHIENQPSLFELEYVPDKLILGFKQPTVRNPNHSNHLMRKPFIFWDGEGYTDEWGMHHYWLLANSLGDKLIAPPGRSLERSSIARLFNRVWEQNRSRGAIHVGFALGYDYTMMIRSNGMSNVMRSSLHEKQYFKADEYMWKLMMGKQLEVWIAGKGNQTGKFNLQDVWGFFQRSFIKALDEYFNKDWPYREIIVEMKAKRSTFDRMHDEEVMRYNDMELELGVMLMEELRQRLYTAGMPISRWYGPGALANGLMQQW